MIRSEESKRLWSLAEAARDWQAMDAIEAQWSQQAEPEPVIDWSNDSWDEWATEELPWTADDEAGLEEYEETKRRRIAEASEF